jgi:hypothetical protein
MPNKAGRSSEHDIAIAVLRYLATIPHGEATTDEIKAHIPNFIDFTGADMEVSGTRPNEMVWEQQVRNIVSHRKTDGNAICDGLIAYKPGRMAITDAGRYWLSKR